MFREFDERMTSQVAENCSRLLFLEAPGHLRKAKARQPRLASVVSQLNDFMADLAPAIPPVPRPPLNNIINLPPLPENPPVSKNVVDGYKYKEDMAVAHGMQNQHDSYYHEYLQVFRSVEAGLVSDDHLANAFTYQLNLVQARAGAGVFNSLAFRHPRDLFTTDAAPAWFHVAMQQLLDPIKQHLDRLTALSTQTARLSAVVCILGFLGHRYNSDLHI